VFIPDEGSTENAEFGCTNVSWNSKFIGASLLKGNILARLQSKWNQ